MTLIKKRKKVSSGGKKKSQEQVTDLKDGVEAEEENMKYNMSGEEQDIDTNHRVQFK